MIAKLFDANGKLVQEHKIDSQERPDVIILDYQRIFVADPFTVNRRDQWWRYAEAHHENVSTPNPHTATTQGSN